MSETINQGGRPPRVFTTLETEQYGKIASILTKSQCADFFGISETCLREVEKRQPEVYEAYKKGRAMAIAAVATNLVQAANKGNITAQIFYLKTQGGWREKDTLIDDSETPSYEITVKARPPVEQMRITRGEGGN